MKPLDSDRQYAVQVLSAHYAIGSLTTGELESRFERVYAANDAVALHALLDGLPALPQAVAPPPGMYAAAPRERLVAEKRTLALFSETKRRGEWTPAQRNVMKIVFGSATIDLREAHLAPGAVTEFDVVAIAGTALFIVPPGVAVECEGTAIAGAFDHATNISSTAPDAPRIRITGTATMGAVKVRTRLPGESALAAWRREYSGLLR
jgi:Domain of unknown function (DUF1707)